MIFETLEQRQKLSHKNSPFRHFVLIPDSFKGTMSSERICHIMECVIREHVPQAKVTPIPVADGGEGSVDAFLTAVGGEKIFVSVSGPYGEPVEAFYGRLKDGTVVIEMAAAAGLPLAGKNRRAEKTTTYGVGELMQKALNGSVPRLIVGLGGSATNDGGCGAAAACGVRFFDRAGNTFIPVGETLTDIERIDLSGLDPAFYDTEIVTMCDIDNPLTGKNGAAAVFGPQKGADQETIQMLDRGLAHLASIVKRDLYKDLAELKGAGAAGGLGFGMAAFFRSRLMMGIEVVLDTVRFDELAETADLVLTGEGKIDEQSLCGKVVVGVARRAKKKNLPVIAIVGDIGESVAGIYDEGVSAILSTNRVAVPIEEAVLRAKSDLAFTVDNLMRLLAALGHL